MAQNVLNHPDMWEDASNYLFLNPRIASKQQERIKSAVNSQQVTNTIWLKSSGTEMAGEGDHKLVALSKESILYAAMAVNKFFNLKSEDIWLGCLPVFHIGGLAIYARAYLSNSKVIDHSRVGWSVDGLIEAICSHQATLISLVPTQVFDLVEVNATCPATLRFVFVGGGALDKDVYLKARKLGWPLIISYGMTETSAMIASSSPESLYRHQFPEMQGLPHVELKTAKEKLIIRTQALLTGYLFIQSDDTDWQPFDQEFISDDRVSLHGLGVDVLGRSSDLVKILGETVDLAQLERRFSEKFDGTFTIVARPDKRKGYELVLVSEQEIPLQIIADFNQRVMPFERLECFRQLEEIPRTALGKILKKEIVTRFLDGPSTTDSSS